ncbi:MAG: type III pantothenate kinase [Oscillospiraceae bacterium]|jgi:type III pantothenate kinase|nr:type III pantothenate kinase [Oscillospiraceae bacterium]
MLLTMDIGNTHITLGVWDGKSLRVSARMATQRERTGDQYAVETELLLKLHGTNAQNLSGASISSVVPELTGALAQTAERLTGTKPLVLGPGVKTGLALRVDNPAQVGADIVAAGAAAKECYHLPCLVADLGTATKLIALDKDGAFRGCAIAPGVAVSLDALSARASQLPAISFATVGKSIGTNTLESMTSGIVYGTAAMLDGMTARMEEELGESFASLIATGGLAGDFLPHCKRRFLHAPNLVLDGLRRIFLRQTM